MPTGQGLVDRARKHVGEEYILGARAPKDNPNWRGPWDCAEFISWLVYQEAGVLYGCDNNKGDAHKADAYTGFWKRDAETLRIRVPIETAAATAGGILLRYPPIAKKGVGHIVLCDGRGGTIEAMGRAHGVKPGKVVGKGRRWDAGILLPEITYGGADDRIKISKPSNLFAIDAPNMIPSTVMLIQQALKAKGFDPGKIDGDFGRKTMEAVVAFQEAQGLIVDGEVGDETAARLGISLVPAAASTLADVITTVSNVTNFERSGTMLPLIPIALQVLPGLVNLIAGDKSGPLADSINKAVRDITGTADSVAARQKLDTNPAIAAQLQLRLAEIAADQAEKKEQARLEQLRIQQEQEARRSKEQLALVKAQLEQDAVQRKDEFDRFKESLKDVEDARHQFLAASKTGGPASWAPICISLIVTLGFFGVFLFLVSGASTIDVTKGTFQLVNLTLGALVAAFTTVVSFWLGSSQGSRIKDVAGSEIQLAQSKELNETIKRQTESLEKTQSNLIENTQSTLQVVQKASLADKATKGQPVAAAKRSNFPKCLEIVLRHEGGFVNHPADPGGATNLGITQKTLSDWRQERGEPEATVDDVRNLTEDDVKEIYRTKYWNVLRCEDLPAGVDLMVFDFGVNAGPATAAKRLQKAVGAESDGSIGNATLAATKELSPDKVIRKFSELRLEYYRGLKTFDTFGRGWTNRAREAESAALAMIEREAA